MGVNTSKSEAVGQFKSRDSEHVLHIESFDSCPSSKPSVTEEKETRDEKIELEKTIPSTESNCIKANGKSVQKGTKGDCWKDKGKISKDNKDNSADSDVEYDLEDIDEPNNIPLTDAEKRLHQYMKEKGKNIKTIHAKEAVKSPPSKSPKELQDTIATSHGPIRKGTGICIHQTPDVSSDQMSGHSPGSPTNKIFSNVVSSQKPKPEAVIMSNADILLHRRVNQVSPLAKTDKNKDDFGRDDTHKRHPRGLGPVGSKRPGQSEIINQLGQQGIIPPRSETDRTLGELRQIGLIKERPGGTQYTLSIEKPKRQAPKLAPLHSDYVPPVRRLPDTPPPQPLHQSGFDFDKNECCGPLQIPMTPCMEALTDRAWDEEVLPLEIQYSGVSDRLRVKMMELDLL